MAEFAIHTLDSAPDGSKGPLASLQQGLGFIPNLAATMAASPTLIEGFIGLQQRLARSTLTGVERELVGLTVSFENRCEYSMAAHSTFAQRNGAAEEVIAALRSGRELPDARLEALHAFTRRLLQSRGHLDPGDVEALYQAGYTTEQLLEVIAQASYTSMANWAANLTDTPVDDAFQARRWAAVA
jgi:uncharacterized peroxidase-related enzyme